MNDSNNAYLFWPVGLSRQPYYTELNRVNLSHLQTICRPVKTLFFQTLCCAPLCRKYHAASLMMKGENNR